MGKIASKLMFAPPPARAPLNPDYIWIHTENESKIPIHCISNRGGTSQEPAPSLQDFSYLKGSYEVSSLMNISPPKTKFYILFSHANAEDLFLMERWIVQNLLERAEFNCIVYEYTGYGESEGKKTQSSLFADIEAVYLYLT